MKFWSWISKENFFIPRNSIGRLLPWLWSETVFFSYLFPTLKVKKNYPESLLEVTVQVPKPCSQRLLTIWFEVGREDMSLQQALWLSRCHWDPDEASGIAKVLFHRLRNLWHTCERAWINQVAGHPFFQFLPLRTWQEKWERVHHQNMLMTPLQHTAVERMWAKIMTFLLHRPHF